MIVSILKALAFVSGAALLAILVPAFAFATWTWVADAAKGRRR